MNCVVCDKELSLWEIPNVDRFSGRRPAALCDDCARANQTLPTATGESHEEAQVRLEKEYPGAR